MWSNFAPYFNKKENWGDHSKVLWFHIHHLWLIRTHPLLIECPMIIHCSYEETGHGSNSYHHRDGVSVATDFHFKCKEVLKCQSHKMVMVLRDLNLSNLCGLGVYPEWNNPGFHFDSRGKRMRWGKINGKYEYDMKKVYDYLNRN